MRSFPKIVLLPLRSGTAPVIHPVQMAWVISLINEASFEQTWTTCSLSGRLSGPGKGHGKADRLPDKDPWDQEGTQPSHQLPGRSQRKQEGGARQAS